jgi:hypothetical protein
MKKMNKVILLGCVVMLMPTCGAFKAKKVEKEMKQPINCAHAEGDIRVLQSEKAHVASEIANGVTAIIPASLVIGLVTLTEGEKVRIATGEYNKAIDKRIAEIKAQCGVQ